MPNPPGEKSPRSQGIRKFVVFFTVAYVLIFVDVHFLAFFPLTVRDPLSVSMSAIVALLGGLCAGASVMVKDDD